MAQFVLMLPHSEDRYKNLSDADFMDIMTDYIGWVDDMTEKGIFVGGEKLTDDHQRTLTRLGEDINVHDGPFTEAAEILGGFMIVKAKDFDEAEQIARSGPHLKHNTKLIIREVAETDG